MNGQRVPLRSVPGRGFRGAVLLALPSPGQTDRLAGFADRERGRAQNGGLVHCHRNSQSEIEPLMGIEKQPHPEERSQSASRRRTLSIPHKSTLSKRTCRIRPGRISFGHYISA
jgi:hypothetical protein